MGMFDFLKKDKPAMTKVDPNALAKYQAMAMAKNQPTRVDKPPYNLAAYFNTMDKARYWENLEIDPDYEESDWNGAKDIFAVGFPKEAEAFYKLIDENRKELFMTRIDSQRQTTLLMNYITMHYPYKLIHSANIELKDSPRLMLLVSEHTNHTVKLFLYPPVHYRKGTKYAYTPESKELYNKIIAFIEDSKETSIEELTDGYFSYMG